MIESATLMAFIEDVIVNPCVCVNCRERLKLARMLKVAVLHLEASDNTLKILDDLERMVGVAEG